MGNWMTDNCTVVRHNERLQQTLDRCQEWKERYKRVKLSDTGMWTNQNLSFARATRDMILLAEAILQGALLRNESRGAHYKPAFPERDDDEFPQGHHRRIRPGHKSPRMCSAPVDISLIPPRAREYGKKADPAIRRMGEPSEEPSPTTSKSPPLPAARP